MFICVIWISVNLENDGKNLQDAVSWVGSFFTGCSIPLVGKDSAGMWWTRRAQPFAQLALQQLHGGKAG